MCDARAISFQGLNETKEISSVCLGAVLGHCIPAQLDSPHTSSMLAVLALGSGTWWADIASGPWTCLSVSAWETIPSTLLSYLSTAFLNCFLRFFSMGCIYLLVLSASPRMLSRFC